MANVIMKSRKVDTIDFEQASLLFSLSVLGAESIEAGRTNPDRASDVADINRAPLFSANARVFFRALLL